jgi:hypothetical protein
MHLRFQVRGLTWGGMSLYTGTTQIAAILYVKDEVSQLD